MCLNSIPNNKNNIDYWVSSLLLLQQLSASFKKAKIKKLNHRKITDTWSNIISLSKDRDCFLINSWWNFSLQ